MRPSLSLRRSTVLVAALVLAQAFFVSVAGSAYLQDPTPQAVKQDFKPEVGQHGKDVVWVPTPQALVDRMLDWSNAAVSIGKSTVLRLISLSTFSP